MWCQISTQVYRFDRVVTRACGAVLWRSKRRKMLQWHISKGNTGSSFQFRHVVELFGISEGSYLATSVYKFLNTLFKFNKLLIKIKYIKPLKLLLYLECF